MKRLTLLSVFIFFAITLPVFAYDVIGDEESVPQGTSVYLDNFEKGNYWIWASFDWEQWGPPKLSTSARVSTQWASEGRSSLECKVRKSFSGSDLSGMFYMDHRWDFSGAKYIVFDVYNPEDVSLGFSMSFQTSDNWDWNETSYVSIEPGKHTIVLSTKQFTNALSLVYRINICYHESTPLEGHFFVDNMRFIK